MRAVVIDDKDAVALVEQLTLAKYQASHISRRDPEQPASVDDVHRWFHRVVVTWLQEQGAKTIR